MAYGGIAGRLSFPTRQGTSCRAQEDAVLTVFLTPWCEERIYLCPACLLTRVAGRAGQRHHKYHKGCGAPIPEGFRLMLEDLAERKLGERLINQAHSPAAQTSTTLGGVICDLISHYCWATLEWALQRYLGPNALYSEEIRPQDMEDGRRPPSGLFDGLRTTKESAIFTDRLARPRGVDNDTQRSIPTPPANTPTRGTEDLGGEAEEQVAGATQPAPSCGLARLR